MSKILKYGDLITIRSANNNEYLSRVNNDTNTFPNNPVYLILLSPVTTRNRNREPVYVGDNFFLKAESDDMYLQRYGKKVWGGRDLYGLEFVPPSENGPTQYLSIDGPGKLGTLVEKGQPVALSFGGVADGIDLEKDPNIRTRRLLTIAFPPYVLSGTWGEYEKVLFNDALRSHY
ncbi:1954_t:CDS:1 [Ambispora gerdemannii]|uniref:1954_t:CDS:1 n=1 Tax=Ambispora gerdemannii TaxID=144530 RepID=A0A9N8Z343_9GLOM|nr:1954_t:CDS:1 [Ambispora gerdemannii]